MSKLFLKENPTMKDYQQYLRDMVNERGFEDETIPDLFMLLSEEIGELAKAARQYTNIKSDENSHKPEVDLEAADVFMYILNICNFLDIDLEKAFRDKEEINKKRTWK
jgi:NTP pyrophosphatase (non-canonical NTP hydrolase)